MVFIHTRTALQMKQIFTYFFLLFQKINNNWKKETKYLTFTAKTSFGINIIAVIYMVYKSSVETVRYFLVTSVMPDSVRSSSGC